MDDEISLKSIENKWKRLQEICWLEDPSGTGANLQVHLKKKPTPQEETFLEEVMPIFTHNTTARDYVIRQLQGNVQGAIPPIASLEPSSNVIPERIELGPGLSDNILLPPLPLLPTKDNPAVGLHELHVALLEGFSLNKGQVTPVPIEEIKRVNYWLARQQYRIQNSIGLPENTPETMFLEFFKYITDLHEIAALKLKKNDQQIWILAHMNPSAFLEHVKNGNEFTLYGMTEDEFAKLPNIPGMRSRSRSRSSRPIRSSSPPPPFC